MVSKSSITIQILLILAFIVTLASARVEPTSSPPEPSQKFISKKFQAQQCWSALQNIPGCVVEIFQSNSRGQFLTIGPNCCKAISGISNDCWDIMFPFNPSFPPLLKSYCGSSGGGTVPPPESSGGGTVPPPESSGEGGTVPPPESSGEGGTVPPPESFGEGGTVPPPESSGVPPPESSGVPPPESSGVPPPENSGEGGTVPPPESSGVPPPESSGVLPPESSEVPPPESSEGGTVPPPVEASTVVEHH